MNKKPEYINERMVSLRNAVAFQPWPGPPNARAVLLAILDIGCHIAAYGSQDGLTAQIGAGIRRLAENAGLPRSTAGDAVKWLLTSGYIQIATRSDQLATRYRLGKKLLDTPQLSDSSKTINNNYCPYSEAPVWDAKILGHTAELVYLAIEKTEPKTISKLSQETGFAWDTVRKCLVRLKDADLADSSPQGWTRGPATLEEVSIVLNAADIATRRADLHDAERQAWIKSRPIEGSKAWAVKELRRIRRLDIDSFVRQLLDRLYYSTCTTCKEQIVKQYGPIPSPTIYSRYSDSLVYKQLPGSWSILLGCKNDHALLLNDYGLVFPVSDSFEDTLDALGVEQYILRKEEKSRSPNDYQTWKIAVASFYDTQPVPIGHGL